MPLVIRGPVGGGNRGGPFHSQNVEMAFFHTPGSEDRLSEHGVRREGVCSRRRSATTNPVIFEEHKGLYRAPALREVLPDDDYVVPLGKARTVREGTDLTIVTYGAMVHKCVEAAETLATEDGVSVEIIDLRTLLPLDEEAIVASVKKTGRLLVVHEDTRTGGIAGEIAIRVSEKAFEWLDGPMLRVTAIDAPVPYSGSLEDYFLPQTDDVAEGCRYLAAIPFGVPTNGVIERGSN